VIELQGKISELGRLEATLGRIQEENKTKNKNIYKLEKDLRDKKLAYSNLENESFE